jgi:hypothetical protein
MEAVLEKRKTGTQRINKSVLKLMQPALSNNRLDVDDFEYWQAMAEKLDRSVLCNDITMQEIVDEVNAVRKERYEKRNRI